MGFNGQSGARTLTLTGSNANDNTLAAVIGDNGGATSVTKAGGGIWVLSGANTYTGVTTVSGTAVLKVSSLANGGVASNIGASTNAASNLVLNGGTFTYTGGTVSTDRLFSLGTSGITLNVFGTGGVTFTNTGSMGFNGQTGGRTLSLANSNGGTSTIAAIIGDNGGATSVTHTVVSATWALTGANTYTGATTLNGGVLSVTSLANGGSASGIGAATNAATNLVLSSGTLQYTGAGDSTDRLFSVGTSGGNLNASGTGAVNFTNTGSIGFNSQTGARTLILTGTNTGTNTLAAAIGDNSGATALSKTSTGTWVLTGTNSYTGTTNISGGVLQVGNAGTSGTLGSGAVTDNANLTFNRSDSMTVANTISGSGGLSQIGAGTTTLSGTNSYLGGTTISGGVLSVATLANGNSASNIGASSSAATNLVLNGGALQYTGAGVNTDRLFSVGTSGGTVDSSGTGTLVLTNSGSMAFNGQSGARLLTVTGTNTGNNIIAAVIGDNGGATALTKTGAGFWTLTGTNSYSGVTTINGGVLNVLTLANGGSSSGIGASSNAASNVVLNGGTLKYSSVVASAVSTDRLFSVGTSGGTIDASGGFNILFTNTGSMGFNGQSGARTLTLTGSNANDNTLAAVIGDSGGATSVTKAGGGVWVLSGANTYTGATTLTGTGVLKVSSLANGGSASSIGGSTNAASNLVLNGGTFTYTGGTVSTDRLFSLGTAGITLNMFGSGGVTFTNTGTMGFNGQTGARTLTLANSNGGTSTIAAIIGDNGGATSITRSNSGTWALTGVNTYTGATTINGGVLSVTSLADGGSASSIGAATNVATNLVLNGGTLQYTGAATSTDRLFSVGLSDGTLDASGTGAVNFTNTGIMGFNNQTGARTLILTGTNTGNNTLAAAIGDNNSGTALLKSGTGTWVLTGLNSYTGATIIAAGSLQIGNGGTSGFLGIGGVSNSANLTFNHSDSLSIANTISGTGSVTQAGAGTTILSGASSYTGVTTINSGVLNVTSLAGGGSNSNIGASSNAATNLVLNGGTLQYTGTGASTDRLFSVGTSGGTLDGSGTNTLTFTNTGSMGFNGQTGARTLTLTGTNTAGNTLDAVIGDNGGATSLNSVGTGTWILMGASTYTGVTTISGGGILNVTTLANGGSASSLGASSSAASNLVINGGVLAYIGLPGVSSTDRLFSLGTSGGSLNASGSSIINFTNTGSMGFNGQSGARTLTLGGTDIGDNSLAASIGDNGGATSLTKSGTGTWVLSGTSTYTGVTTLAAGVLKVTSLANGGSNSNIGASTNAATNLVFNGGTLRYTGGSAVSTDRLFSVGTAGGTLDSSGTVMSFTNTGSMGFNGQSGARTLTLTGTNGAGNVLAAVIGDSGGATSLIKSGTGTWMLTGNNTYTGTTTISGGTLALGNFGTTGSISGDIVDNGTLMLNNTGGLTLTQTISGTGGVTVNAGSHTLSGTNTYTGVTSIAGGLTLSIATLADGGVASNLGAASNAATNIVLNNGILKYTGSGSSSDRLFGIGTLGGTLNASGTGAVNFTNTGSMGFNSLSGARTLTLTGTNTGANTLAAVIGDNGGATALSKTGAGTWVITGTNSYTGTTTISGGVLQVGSGGTSGMLGSGSVTDSSNLTFNRSDSLTVANTISSTGSLSQIGAGTTTLTGTNSYSGVTTISGGVLSVTTLANGGSNSNIGTSSNAATNLVLNGGALQYTGVGVNTDRLFSVGTSGGTVDSSGTGTLVFTNAGSMAFNGQSGARALTLTGTNTGNNVIAALIGDNGGATALTKTGAGFWTLTGTNSYSGVTTINGGVLNVLTLANGGSNSNIGDSSNAASNLVLNGGTLKYSSVVASAVSTDRLFSVGTSGGTIDASGGFNILFTNTGSMGFNGQSGARTLTLTGSNANDNTLAAVIGDNGGATSVTKAGSGVWVLSGANTYTGATTLTGSGVLKVSSLANGGSASGIGAATNAASNLVLNGGTLQYTGTGATTDRLFSVGTSGITLDAEGTGAVVFSNTGAMGFNGQSGARTLTLTGGLNYNLQNTIAAVIADNGGATSVTKTGDNQTWVLSGLNTYTGVTTVTGGGSRLSVSTLTNGGLASGIGAASSAASNIILDGGGTLEYRGSGASTDRLFSIGTGGGGILSAGTGAINYTNTGAMGFVGSGARTLQLSGGSSSDNTLAALIGDHGGATSVFETLIGSRWLLTNANTYTGVTSIAGTTLSVSSLANGGVASNIGSSTNAAANLLLNSGGTLQYTGAANSTDRLFTIGSVTGGTLDASGTGAINFNNTGAISILGPNALTLTLSGTNTGANTLAAVFGNGTSASSLTKSGAGTWVLTGTNTYTGVTTINGGVLSVASLTNGGSSSGIGAATNAAANLVLNGGTLKYTGTAAVSTDRLFSVGTSGGALDVSGTGAVNYANAGSMGFNGQTGARTLTLTGTNAGSNTIATLIGDNGGATSLTKTGTGFWTLTGANTYTGATTISGGGGILTLTTLANGGSASSIGASSNAASNLVLDGAGLVYTSTGSSTDRLFSLGTSSATINSSGTGLLAFTNAGSMGFNGQSGARTLTLLGANANDNSLAAVIGDNGGATALTKSGIGTWVLSGASTYTGVTTLSSGVLKVSSLADGGVASNIGAASNAASNLVFGSGILIYTGTGSNTDRLFTMDTTGATLQASGTGAVNFTNTGSIALSGSGIRSLTLTGTSTAANNLAASIADNGGATSLTKSGVGTWGLSGSSSYTGVTSVFGGVLTVTNLANGGQNSSIGASSSAAANLVLGTTLQYIGAATSTDRLFTVGLGTPTLDASGTGALNFTNTGSLAYSGTGARTLTLAGTNTGNNTLSAVLSDNGGASSLAKSGTGTWLLTGANNYTGSTIINAGVLQVGNGGTSGALGSGAVINSGALVINRSDALTLANSISGAGTFTQAGTGTTTFTGSSGYNGATFVNAGKLQAGAAFTFSSVSAVTLASGSILELNGFNNAIGSLAGSGTVQNGTATNATLNAGGTTSTTFSGLIQDGGSGLLSFNKAGSGTLTLTGSNTYTGGTVVSAGTLSISSLANGGVASNIGASSNAFFNLLLNGGTLSYTGAATSTDRLFSVTTNGGTLDASGTGAVNFTNTGSMGFNFQSGARTLTLTGTNAGANTIAAVIGDNGGATSLTKSGTGQWTLTGANGYTGPTTITGGQLVISRLANGGSASSIGAATNAATNLVLNGGALQYTGAAASTDRLFSVGTSGGTLDASGTGAVNFTNTGSMGFNGQSGARTLTLTGTNTGSNTLAAGIGDSGGATSLVKSGVGTWVLTGTNTYTGTTTINTGVLQVGSGGTTGSLGSGAVTNNASLGINRSDAITLANTISGSGTLIQAGTGTTTLSGTNSYTGATTINSGVLNVTTLANGGINSNIGASSSAAANLVINGGTLQYSGATDATTDRLFSVGIGGAVINVTGSGALNFTNTGSMGFNGQSGARNLHLTGTNSGLNIIAAAIGDFGGATSVTIDGAATWLLTGANNYTGATTVSSGVLKIGGSSLDSAIILGSSATVELNGLNTRIGSLAGSGTVQNNSNSAATLTTGGDNTSTTFGVIIQDGGSGALSLVKTGSGTFTLTGTNTYTGTTTISAGVLQVGSGGTTGTLGTGAVTNNASLIINRSDTTTIANAISGSGSLTQAGSGTTTLTGASTYTGSTTINAGVLSVAAMANGGGTSNLGASTNDATNLVLNGGTLQYTGGATSTDRLFSVGTNGGTLDASGTGAVNFSNTGTMGFNGQSGARSLLLTGTNTGSNTLAAVIGDNGGSTSLTKSGAGTWVLTGTSSYTGSTTINTGVLSVAVLADGGSSSNLGASTNVATNLVLNGGTLQYTGGATSTDRLFSVGTNGGTLDASGTGAVNFTNTGTMGFNGQSGIRTLTLTGTNTGSNTLAAVIGDNGGSTSLTKSGAGTWVLTGTNTYTGTTTISAGVLQIGSGSTTGSLGSGAVTDNGSLVINRSDAVTIANTISGSGTLTQAGAGTTTLTGANTYSGSTTINAGVLKVTTLGNGGSSSNIGASSSAAANLVLNGGTLQYTGALASTDRLFSVGTSGGTLDASGTGAVSFTNTGSMGFNGQNGARSLNLAGTNTGSNTLAAVIGDNGGATSLIKSGVGTWVLTGANTYTGTTTISGGVLQIGNGGTSGTLGSGAVTDNGNLTINRSDALTIANAISGSGTLAQVGSGTTTLTGASTYTGSTTINAGVLSVASIANGGSTSNVGASTSAATNLVLNGGTLQYTGAAASTDRLFSVGTSGGTLDASGTGAVSFTNTGSLGFNSQSGTRTLTLTGNNTGSNTLAAGIGDSGGATSLVKSGAGTWVLTGANTYTGTTTINAGVLKIGSGGTTGTLGSGAVTNNGSLVINRSDAITLANTISGSGTFTQAGAGTTTLSGTNLYTGVTTINAGVLNVTLLANGGSSSNIGAAASAAANLVLNGGTLQYSGAAASTDRLFSVGTSGGTLDASGTGAVNFTNTGSMGFNSQSGARNLHLTGTNTGVNTIAAAIGDFGGATSLSVDGSATWLLTGANTFTGTTTVSSGVLKIGGNSLDSAFTLGANAMVELNGLNTRIGSLAGSGIVQNNSATAATLTTGGNNTSTTFSGVMQDGGAGALSLVKTGSGTFTLTGANSYTGTTTISSGVLQVGSGGTTGTLGTGAVTNNASLILNRSDATTIANAISGSGSLTQAGSGTTTLTGANTYTGSTTINAGVLSVAVIANGGSSSNVGASTSASTNLVLNGGTLQYTGADVSTDRLFSVGTNGGTLDASGTGTVNFTNTGSMGFNGQSGIRTLTLTGTNTGGNTLAAAIGDNGSATALTKSGLGTWVITGSNSYSGITSISAGVLQVGNGGIAGTLGSGAVTDNGSLVINRSDAITIANTISGAGSFTQAGAGTITLSGISSFTGSTTINSGVLSVAVLADGGSNSNLGASTSAAANLVLNGGNLQYTGADVSTDHLFSVGTNGGTLDASGTGAVNFTNTGSMGFNGQSGTRILTLTGTNSGSNILAAVIADNSGATNLSKSGTGFWVLTGTNTYAGTTTISAGVLQVGSGGTTGTLGTGAVTNNGSLIINRSDAITLANAISGSGSLTNAGSGTTTLSGNSIYTGSTTINAGVLSVAVIANGGSSSNLGASTNVAPNLVINGGTLQYTGGAVSTDRLFSVGTNGGTLDASGTGAVNFTNTGSMDFNSQSGARSLLLTGTNSGSNTLAAVITDNGGATSLTKSGPGTWVLSGANSYTGATTISAGTLQIGDGGTTGSLSSSSVLNNNGTLAFNRTDTLTQGTDFAGVISGSGGVTQAGSGTLILNGANTYAGATNVRSGTLEVTSNNALGTAAAGTSVSNGATLLLNNVNYSTAEALTLNGKGVGNGGALRNSGTSTYTGAITAATDASINAGGGILNLTGGLVKDGTVLTITGGGTVYVSGTGISGSSANSDLVVDATNVVVSADSNYNGPTTVQNNAVLVANAAVTTTQLDLSSDSMLAGTGGITTAVNQSILINGTLSVGDPGVPATASTFALTTSGAGAVVLGTGSLIRLDLFTGAGLGNNLSNTTSSDSINLHGKIDATAGATVVIGNPNGMTNFHGGDQWQLVHLNAGDANAGGFVSTLALNDSSLHLARGVTSFLDQSNGVFSIIDTNGGLALAAVEGQALISGGNTVTSDLNGHLFNLRSGGGEEDPGSISASLDEGVVVSQGDGDPKKASPIAKRVLRSRQWEVFATVNYGNVKLNPIRSQSGVQVDSWASGAGVERHLSRGLTLGFAASFLESTQGYTGNAGSLHLEGPALSAYISYVRGSSWNSLLYSFGTYQMDSIRNPGLPFPTAFGSTRTYTHSVQYNTGWNFRFQNNTLVTGPFAGVDYLHGSVDAYSETGGGLAALHYSAQSYQSLVSRVGWSASKQIKTNFATITPQLRLSYERQNIKNNNGTSVSLINVPFSSSGGNQTPGQDYLVAGLGLSLAFSEQFSLMLSYQGQFFRHDLQAHFGSIRFSYQF